MKKTCFRLLSISTALVLLACSVGGRLGEEGLLVQEASAEMEYQGVLELGVLQEVSLHPEKLRMGIFQFIPEETDSYVFYSLSDISTSAFLFNRSGTIVDSDLTSKGNRNNFALECQLTAGETYYFGAQYSESSSQIGSFRVGIRKTMRLSMFENVQNITGVMAGTGKEIPREGDAVYACFQPQEDGYYNIYSKDFCGCQGNCQAGCSCWSGDHCGCLNYLKATVYVQDEEGKLQALYCNTASDTGNGFLIRDYFQEGQSYYLVIMAADETQTGKFQLAVGKDLSEVSLEQLAWEQQLNLVIENKQENLFYKVIPEKDGTYHFTSEGGQNLYGTLYDKNMTALMETDSLEDNINQDVALYGGQEYYLKLSTLSEQTFWFYLTASYVSPDMPLPDDGTGNIAAGGDGNGGAGSEQDNRIPIGELKMAKIPDKAYTGKKIRPAVSIKYQGSLLVKGMDYRLSYKNNKKIGNATVTIEGIGNYRGTRKAQFHIVPKKAKLKSAKRSGTQLSLKWKKVAGVTGYEVSYSYAKKFKAVAKKKTKKASLSLSLKKNKTCYVRVRAYKMVKKKTFYGIPSKVKKL